MNVLRDEILEKMVAAKYMPRLDGSGHGICVSFGDPNFARKVSREGALKGLLKEQGLTVRSNSGAAAPEGCLIYEVDAVPTNVGVKESIEFICEHLWDQKNALPKSKPHTVVEGVAASEVLQSANHGVQL